VNIWRT